MRTLLICLLTLLLSNLYAGFHFPDEDFAYAKIYYFNTGELDGKPDTHIYTKEDGWAKSMVDIEKISSKALTSNIEKLFLYGADGLLTGLSKCFIPRHGVVYFDDKDQPVASFSICFECQAVRMWTKSTGVIHPKSGGSESRAAQQITTLRKFILNEEIIVSEDPSDYPTQNSFLDKLVEKSMEKAAATEPRLTNEHRSITYDMTELDERIVKATYNDVWNWNTVDTFSEYTNTEYSAGGEKYEFIELHVEGGTSFYFDGPGTNAQLVEATILYEHIVLPNGLQVGSPLEDVLDQFGIYNGPMEPGIVIYRTEFQSIQYHIIDKKVWKIKIDC
jgi:hypothetical protein